MSKRTAYLTLLLAIVCLLAITVNASANFMDDFSDTDFASNGWYTNLLFGRPGLDYLYPQANRLSVHMPNYNTALYLLNENTNTADSTVEATLENAFSTHSEAGIVCRYNDYGWYELRVTLSGQYAGSFSLYKYDKTLLEDKENPFVSLLPGVERIYTRDIKLGLNAQNTLKMICEGNTIRVFINGNEQFHPWNKEFRAAEYPDGISGISFWAENPKGIAQTDVLSFRSLFEE